MTVPAESKKAAKEYLQSAGMEIIKMEDHELKDIDINRLAETLYSNGWGTWEIDTITRVLIQCGLDRK